MLERGSFLTKYASEIESDPVGDYPRAKACLKELGFDPEVAELIASAPHFGKTNVTIESTKRIDDINIVI